MAKKKPARPARPQKSAEPTTAQLRQEYYARRAAEQALEELGLRSTSDQPPKGDAHWWADDARRARPPGDHPRRLALHRPDRLRARARGLRPRPGLADRRARSRPSSGPGTRCSTSSGIDDAIFGVVVEKALAAHEKLGAREKELEVQRAQARGRGASKIPELKRREEVARAKRDEADGARQEAEAARDAVARERDARAARVAALERGGRRRCAPRPRPPRAGGARRGRAAGGDGARARRRRPRRSRRATSCTSAWSACAPSASRTAARSHELTQLLARVDAEAAEARGPA